jgi:hypothetical protein
MSDGHTEQFVSLQSCNRGLPATAAQIIAYQGMMAIHGLRFTDANQVEPDARAVRLMVDATADAVGRKLDPGKAGSRSTT